ncbi:hypothetical protein ACFVRD_09450 [Streptomyces sp. NPDC057908]|uniref:hypothetical protein n=1 Tax=Streptomyces sp. NPDC057908 TaxID=3346276 RepID=UPI0036E8A4E4
MTPSSRNHLCSRPSDGCATAPARRAVSRANGTRSNACATVGAEIQAVVDSGGKTFRL